MTLLQMVFASVVILPSSHNAFLERQLVLRGFTAAQAREEVNRKEFRVPMLPVKEELLTWDEFEQRLLSPESLDRGKAYLERNRPMLVASSIMFGVSPEGLVALTRVESDLEDNPGKYEIYKLLYKRANQPDKGAALAAIRFAALAAYCRHSGLDCLALRGSRDGALGIVQFMPDTLESYGVDGNGDGFINLWDPLDALPSAAKFLKRLGWESNPGKALARYYGSPKRYPDAVLKYALALQLASLPISLNVRHWCCQP